MMSSIAGSSRTCVGTTTLTRDRRSSSTISECIVEHNAHIGGASMAEWRHGAWSRRGGERCDGDGARVCDVRATVEKMVKMDLTEEKDTTKTYKLPV